ncbi:aspartyl-tRNA amidotransferase subunit B [Ralstonia solanacearum]|nr:aspartyl-tRNA amidotransferase subunit B [Ralstonia solanacearum]
MHATRKIRRKGWQRGTMPRHRNGACDKRHAAPCKTDARATRTKRRGTPRRNAGAWRRGKAVIGGGPVRHSKAVRPHAPYAPRGPSRGALRAAVAMVNRCYTSPP